MSFKKCLKFFVDFIGNIEQKIIIFLFVEVVIVGFMQVMARFVFKSALPWSEELLRFSFVWITFLSASVAVTSEGHVSVDMLIDKLKSKLKKGSRILVKIIGLLFSTAIFILSLKLISTLFRTGQKSAAMGIPMWIPYISILISFFFMILKFLVKIFEIADENSSGT